jgi:DNA-binding CsgD family transcriptional regulator
MLSDFDLLLLRYGETEREREQQQQCGFLTNTDRETQREREVLKIFNP